MKTTLKRLITDERGKVLVLVLVLLVVGGLVMSPLLGLMGTGLASGHTYEKKASELYAADAGVEQAIWHLQQGGGIDEPLTLSLNGKPVVVEIAEVPTGCGEPALFDIFSKATSPEEGSTTTVYARVSGIMAFFKGDKYLTRGQKITGNVWVEGTLDLDKEAEVTGWVRTGGNLTLNSVALVGGIVCVGGDLWLNEGASIKGDVYVMGNVKLTGGTGKASWIEGDVYTEGNVNVDGFCEIQGQVWAGGDSVRVDKNAKIVKVLHVTSLSVVENSGTIGGIQDDYHDDWFCPLGETAPKIEIWLIV